MGSLKLSIVFVLLPSLATAESLGDRLRSSLQAQIQAKVNGKVTIGGLEGNLLNDAALTDIAIDDPDGKPALRIRRATLLYDTGALFLHTIHIKAVKLDGVTIHARHLADGRLNLAALAKPAAQAPAPAAPPSSAPSAQVYVERVVVDPIAWRYDLPKKEGAVEFVDGEMRVEAGFSVDNGTLRIHLISATGLLLHPCEAQLSASGSLIADERSAKLERVTVAVATLGEQLNQLAPGARFLGRWQATLAADGPADQLAVKLTIAPPKGTVAADLTVGNGAYQGALTADLDPAAAWRDAPAGRATLAAKLQGSGDQGAISVEKLEVDASGLKAIAHGTVELRGAITGELTFDAPDLAKLAPLGVVGLGGSLAGRAHLSRRSERTHVEVEAHGGNLAYHAFRARHLDGTLRADDLRGSLRLQLREAAIGEIRFDTLAAAADGTEGRAGAVTLHVEGAGPDAALLADAHAPMPAATKKGPRVIDATIDRLSLARHGVRFAMQQAASLRLGETVELKGLALAGAGGTLAVDGKAARGHLDATVAVHGLDAAPLATLAGLALDVPHTKVDGRARARGSVEAPALDVELSGDAEPKLGALHFALAATVAGGRARGTLSASGAFRADAHFDWPTANAPAHPIKLDLAVDGLAIAALDPKSPLVGALSLRAQVGGTASRPELDATLSAPSLALGPSRGALTAQARYRGLALVASANLDFGAAGALDASLVLPMDLDLHKRVAHHGLLPTLPLDGAIALRGLDLAKLPTARPLAGRVAMTARAIGTLRAPRLSVDADARGLTLADAPGLDRIDLVAHATYGDRRAIASARADRAGSRLLDADADMALDLGKLLDGIDWAKLPLRADATLPGYPLDKLTAAAVGALSGGASLRGTVEKPTAELHLAADDTKLGATRLKLARADAAIDSDGARGEISLTDGEGGTLRLEGAASHDGARHRVALAARRFRLDLAELGDAVRTLRATVDGGFTVDEKSRAGRLRVEDGLLALGDRGGRRLPGVDTLPYEKIAVDVAIDAGAIELRGLSLRHGSGTLAATAKLALDGWKVRRLDADMQVESLPILLAPHGVWGGWFDADVALRADLAPSVPTIEIAFRKGGARIPKIDLVRETSLQPIGPLADVAFAGEQPADSAPSANVRAKVVARLDGPFRLKSTGRDGHLGVTADLIGAITIDLDGARTTITGGLAAVDGELEVFGRPFALERARLDFDGSPAPVIDFRATREVGDATVGLAASGTLRKPEVALFSEPPIFDKQQVEQIIVSGDPGGSPDDTDQRGVGNLTGIIAGELKNAIAPHLALFDVVRVNESSETTGVEVGKWITDNIYLSFVHQFVTLTGTRKANQNQGQLEWRFLRRFLAEAYFGDESVGGLDFYWSKRY